MRTTYVCEGCQESRARFAARRFVSHETTYISASGIDKVVDPRHRVLAGPGTLDQKAEYCRIHDSERPTQVEGAAVWHDAILMEHATVAWVRKV